MRNRTQRVREADGGVKPGVSVANPGIRIQQRH